MTESNLSWEELDALVKTPLPESPEELEALRERIQSWMHELDDALSKIKVDLADARRAFAEDGIASDRNWLRSAERARGIKARQRQRLQERLGQVSRAARVARGKEFEESLGGQLRRKNRALLRVARAADTFMEDDTDASYDALAGAISRLDEEIGTDWRK